MKDVKNRIKALRRNTASQQIFGAEFHRFCLHRVREKEIALFEEESGAMLPDDFRQHLLRWGAGAGPYYGIMSPKEMTEELLHPSCGRERTLGTDYRPSARFPISTLSRVSHPYPSDGAVVVCQQGCTGWSVIVLTGEFRGTVWDVDCTSDEWWSPAQRPFAGLKPYRHGSGLRLAELPCPPTFEQWYESWLEACEHELETEQQNKPYSKMHSFWKRLF